jgi:hypothetical protein
VRSNPAVVYVGQGCQMVYFQTEKPNPGKFWKALEWKRLVYCIATWSIIRPFGIFYGHLIIYIGTYVGR